MKPLVCVLSLCMGCYQSLYATSICSCTHREPVPLRMMFCTFFTGRKNKKKNKTIQSLLHFYAVHWLLATHQWATGIYYHRHTDTRLFGLNPYTEPAATDVSCSDPSCHELTDGCLVTKSTLTYTRYINTLHLKLYSSLFLQLSVSAS